MANFNGYSPTFGGNQWRFEADVSRSGNTVSVRNVYVTPKWGVQSLQNGWTFTVWINGTAITSETKRNWSAGSNSGSGFGGGRTYLNLNCDGTVSASSTATVKIGVAGMNYNGTYYTNLTYSQNFASIAIIPNVPSISLSWDDPTSFVHKGVNVYRYQSPVVRVTSNGNATHTRFLMQYKDLASFTGTSDNSGWINSGQANNGSFQSGNISQRFAFGTDWRSCVGRIHADARSSTGNESSWSGWVYFIINDLPVMNGNNVKVNSSIVVDAVTLSWSSATDVASTSKGYKIYVTNKSTGGVKTLEVGDTTSHTFNLSSVGIEKGQQATIQIEPKDNLEWSGTKYGNVTVTRNSLPKFPSGAKITTNADNSPYNKYFLDKISVTIPLATDSEGQGLQYRAYYRKRTKGSSWGNWLAAGALDGNRVKDITPTMNKGEEVQFGAVAYDGLEYSQSVSGNGDLIVMSQVLTKATNPSATSAITVSPTLDPGTIHYESIDSVNWKAVTACNNTSVSTYEVSVEVKQTTDSSTVIYQAEKKVNNATSTPWDITTSNFTRGYYFRFKVVAVDMFGLNSPAKYTQWFRRNRVPGAVPTGSFKVNSAKINFYQTVPLKWDKATDPDGDAVTYRIYFSKNREAFTQIASGLTTLTYTHNIDNLGSATTLGYKIVAYDKFGVASAETLIEKCHSLVVNTPPNAPQIIYPSSKIYDAKPRILFQTNGDKNNDSLSIVVTHNGEVFNSATSASMFNKTSFDASGDHGVFIPKILKEGINTLKFKAFDGYQYSPEVTFNIEYKTPSLNPIGANNDILISKAVYDKFITMITDSRKAYGLAQSSYNSVTSNQTFVTATDFNKLYTTILEVNSYINNNYPGLNRSKTKPNISKNNLISKEVHNSILDIIVNL